MKKSLLLLVSLLLSASLPAQGSFGIKAGLNYTSFDISNDVGVEIRSSSGFHAGIAYKVKVPLIGLSFQPELLYSQKNFDIDEGTGTHSYKISYAEVPLNIQMGINLLLFRPFVFASPYVSYAISKGGEFSSVDWDSLNRLDYGVGLGAGVELWKLQVSGKYNWSMKKLNSNQMDIGDAKLKGFQLSVAFLF